MKEVVLAIDLGTTSCKAAMFDEQLREMCSCSTDYPTIYLQQGWAEQPASQWWEALVRCTRRLIESSGVASARIACVGIDTMGSIALPVDRDGTPLRNGLIWMDRRSEKECQWIDREMTQLLWEQNGNHNDPSNIAPKILWIKNNEPDVYRKTHKFLHGNGYLVYRLTGKYTQDLSNGGLTQLFDTRNERWSDDLIRACGIDREKLPDVYRCQDVVGTTTREASAETGLPQGIPVVAGAMDCVASALGSGVSVEGDIYMAGGTVTATGVCADKAVFNPYLHVYSHIIPGRFLLVGGVDFGGAGLKWFKELLGETDYDSLNRCATENEIPAHPLVFLPYMVGQRAPLWDSTTSGVIAGLHPSTTKGELAHMFMVGNALGARKILSLVESLGIRPGQMRLTGGCSLSEPWCQVFSDVTSREIRIPGSMDVAVLGSAVTAAVGTGVIPSYSDAIGMIPTRGSYSPGRRMARYYDDLYGVFCKLFESVREVYRDLNRLEQKDYGNGGR